MIDTDSELLALARRRTQILENLQAMAAFLLVVLALAGLVALVHLGASPWDVAG